MLLGVDVGGTFTDAALYDGRVLHSAKVPTTPDDQAAGVLEAIGSVLERAGAPARDVTAFAHGMTVGTNALLTGEGARTALIATDGFTDLLDVARQDRPHLYRLCMPKAKPIVADDLRLGVAERVGPAGVVEALSEGELDRVVAAARRFGVEAIAVCLLFSYLEPAHERAIAERLRAELPGVHVSASHEVLAQFREYERCSTTVIDAYLSPLLGDYLGRLTAATRKRGLPEPAVMMSSGGVAPATEAARAGAWSVLSGPAGGAVGAGLLARTSGDGSALGFDMGGTSCDVCVIEDGRVRRTDSRRIGGRVIQLPMVDVHTVGAGGGSIGWRDPGGALQVGPRSAGAEPGPACYGRGGEQPTVTDANLLLGYLDTESTLAGGIALDANAAGTAVGRLAQDLGIAVIEAARGIVRVANQEMARALRVVTVERGIDPRGFALLPFGGAGPMHAAAIAEELGIARILCPRASGVLSALGLVASERRRDAARTVMLTASELTRERISGEVAALAGRLGAGMTKPRTEVVYELRYSGQGFELPIPGPRDAAPGDLGERFAAEHELRYGYRDPEAAIELVTIRVALIESAPDPRVEAAETGRPQRRVRRARFGERWLDTAVVRGHPGAGATAEGPCVFELPEATLVLPPGWAAQVDPTGTIVAERRS